MALDAGAPKSAALDADLKASEESYARALKEAPPLAIVSRGRVMMGLSRGERIEALGLGEPWPELDLAALAEREPAPPQFIAPDWLPCGYASLFAGHGGVGKSGIALHFAVCMRLGLPFFGLQVEKRRVLYLSCEDRENVLHWRLSRICRHLNVDLTDLSDALSVLDLVGHECILWERDPHTGYTTTGAFAKLQALVEAHKTEVLFVDGISDTFAGNENARSEVKRYVNALVSLIPADRGAVVLIGHIAKPSAASAQTSEGYSGSTAWHNSVRARWYLRPEAVVEDGGRPERTGDLLLEPRNRTSAEQIKRCAFGGMTTRICLSASSSPRIRSIASTGTARSATASSPRCARCSHQATSYQPLQQGRGQLTTYSQRVPKCRKACALESRRSVVFGASLKNCGQCTLFARTALLAKAIAMQCGC